MGEWRRGCRGSRPGRGGGGAWGRRRREWGVSWALTKAHRQDSLCHAIVDQVGIVDQGVKQVKVGAEKRRAGRLTPNPQERSLRFASRAEAQPLKRRARSSLAGLKPGLYSFHGGCHRGASELCVIQSRV